MLAQVGLAPEVGTVGQLPNAQDPKEGPEVIPVTTFVSIVFVWR